MTLGGPAPTAPSFFSSLFSLPWKQCTVAPYVDPVAFFAGTSVFYSVSEEGREFSPCSPSNCSRSPSLLRTVISACPLCPSVPHWIPGNYEKVLHRLYCTLHVKALGWCWQKHSTLRFISPVWVLMCPGEPVPGSPGEMRVALTSPDESQPNNQSEGIAQSQHRTRRTLKWCHLWIQAQKVPFQENFGS